MEKYVLDLALRSRLYNYKFASARGRLTGHEPKEVQNLVEALSVSFGNCGWIDGEMGVIIHHALDNLGVWDDDEPVNVS